MNIAIYFENCILPECGGTERAAENVADLLSELGHKICYIAKYPNKDADSTKYPTSMLPSSDIFDNRNKKFIEDYVRENNIDVIINEGGNTDDVKLINHKALNIECKIITCLHMTPYGIFNKYWLHDIRKSNLKSLLSAASRLFKRRYFYNLLDNNFSDIIEYTDLFIVLTEDHKKTISNHLKLSQNKSDKITIVKNINSFDSVKFNSNDLINKENSAVFAGRQTYEIKRVDRIIHAWTNIPNRKADFSLNILGEGKDLEEFKRMASKDSSIIFRGKTDPLPFYRAAKVICLASNSEAFPMVLIEGMSQGCVPVVYNTFGAASEIIQNGVNGFLIKPFDHKSYIDSIHNLLNNSILFQKMALSAIESSHRYSKEAIQKDWHRILESIAN